MAPGIKAKSVFPWTMDCGPSTCHYSLLKAFTGFDPSTGSGQALNSDYSLRKAFTGFDIAAFNDSNPTVAQAMTRASTPAPAMTKRLTSTR